MSSGKNKMKDYEGKSRGFFQGTYIVENRQKYLGTKIPIYRSSWEADMCRFFDLSKTCLKWISEPDEFNIPYELPDGSKHIYHPDFYVEMMTDDGTIKKFLVEVKPAAESPRHNPPPKEPRVKNTRTMSQFSKKIRTYYTNKIKWDTAEKYLKKYKPDVKFMVVTEIEAKFMEYKKKRK